MARSIELDWQRAPNGQLASGIPAINTDRSWRIADQFKMAHSFDMLPKHPRFDYAVDVAAHKWCNTYEPFHCQLSWVGGQPPFRGSVFKGPPSSKLGTAGKVQIFSRTPDPDEPGMYNHDLPENWMDFNFDTENLEQGEAVEWAVLIEDSSDRFFVFNATTVCDNDKFKWFSPTGSDLTGDGSFLNRYASFGKSYTMPNAGQYICRFATATYYVHNGTPGNDAAMNAMHSRSYICDPGTIFNCSQGNFSKGVSDLTFKNVKITGYRADKTEVSLFDMDLQCDRLHFVNVELDPNFPGTVGGNNQAGVFLHNLGSGIYHKDVSFINCHLASTAKSQMIVLYNVDGGAVERCTGIGFNMPAHNGAHFIHFKASCRNVMMRFCKGVGITNSGLVWFSNQAPTECINEEMSYCILDYTGNTLGNATRWNGQVGGSDPNGKNQYSQKNTIVGGVVNPYRLESYGTGIEKVNLSSQLWTSTQSTLFASTGGVEFGEPSSKVLSTDLEADYSMKAAIKPGRLGYVGHVISSTLVT